MAWYKPARNRNHPGDPPPKWAPISRAGRLVLVVTVIAGVVIAFVIIATRSAEATDDAAAACSLVRYAPIELTADPFLHESFGQSDSIVVESLREGLSRVLVNGFGESRIMTAVPKMLYVDHYAIADDAVAVLWCSGDIAHREVWRAIAESVESLPGEV